MTVLVPRGRCTAPDLLCAIEEKCKRMEQLPTSTGAEKEARSGAADGDGKDSVLPSSSCSSEMSGEITTTRGAALDAPSEGRVAEAEANLHKVEPLAASTPAAPKEIAWSALAGVPRRSLSLKRKFDLGTSPRDNSAAAAASSACDRSSTDLNAAPCAGATLASPPIRLVAVYDHW